MGWALARRQSMRAGWRSSFARTVWDRKFVSTMTWYGGTRLVFAWKKRWEGAWGISRTGRSAASFCLATSLPRVWFFFRRASRWPGEERVSALPSWLEF